MSIFSKTIGAMPVAFASPDLKKYRSAALRQVIPKSTEFPILSLVHEVAGIHDGTPAIYAVSSHFFVVDREHDPECLCWQRSC